ncbi:MAG: hypothetical protein K2X77_21265 [Candidatus Obscuribacterales bacterium]|nr:hypothetical protein [Candidatus Obscuribacterales bacterium]
MELFGLIALLIWMGFCFTVISVRFIKESTTSTVSVLFQIYLALSLLLAMWLFLSNIMFLARWDCELRSWDWLSRLWFLAWSPVSLLMTFFSRRELWDLPASYIVLEALLFTCASLGINDSQPDPPWLHVGFVVVSIIFFAHTVCTCFRYFRMDHFLASTSDTSIGSKD